MKRTKLFAAIWSLVVGLSVTAGASQKIVTFSHSIPERDRITGVQQAGGKIVKMLHIIDAVAAQFPDQVKDADIYTVKGVSYVEEDKYLKWIEEAPAALPLSSVETALERIEAGEYDRYAVPQLPSLIPQPSSFILHPFPKAADDKEIPWGVKRVNASGAWSAATGVGVKAAIIDTGVDYTHPDLAAHYAGGYNAVSTSTLPMDDHGHGTHVSGTIGAIQDGKGVVGVAPGAKLYGVKVLDANGSGTYSNVIDGIQWAADNKMSVINMSLGGKEGTPALAKVMEAADKAGVTIVCAAGNDSGPVNYPAKYPQAIAVSASNSSDKLAYFSSRGPEIAFIAPGVNVYSTYKGAAYKTMSGTSMACPHVAGLAALAVSLGADTPAKVRAALKNAASSLGLKPTEEGAGMIDAAKIK